MSVSLRPTRLEIEDAVIGDNVLTLRRRIRNLARMMAVIKADAYGHGLIETARIALSCGADALAVATVDEGIRLRDARITAPVLVLGGTTPDGAAACVQRHLALALFDAESIDVLQQQAARLNTAAHVHLKIDTGMNRIGLKNDGQLLAMLDKLGTCPNVKVEGIFTHFADPIDNPAFTGRQNVRFKSAVKAVRAAGYEPMAHASASAAMLADESMWYNMVRPGIAMYGASVRHLCDGLVPAQRLVTSPVCIEWVDEGESIGYGCTFTASRNTLVMTLPIGYGDGYPRSLGGIAAVLVRGRRAPIVGRVCMDMMMVDVTDVPGISKHDEVVLMGRDGELRITPDELATLSGTIPYEIMLGFTNRVPVVHV